MVGFWHSSAINACRPFRGENQSEMRERGVPGLQISPCLQIPMKPGSNWTLATGGVLLNLMGVCNSFELTSRHTRLPLFAPPAWQKMSLKLIMHFGIREQYRIQTAVNKRSGSPLSKSDMILTSFLRSIFLRAVLRRVMHPSNNKCLGRLQKESELYRLLWLKRRTFRLIPD